MDPTPPSKAPKNAPKKNGAPAPVAPPPGPNSGELAAQLGVSTDDLKKIRDQKLEPHVDWIPGQPIVFTLAGVAKVRAFLGLLEADPDESEGADAGTEPESTPDAPQPAPARGKAPAERVTLIVSRPARGNPRIVLCHAPDDQGAPHGPELRLQTKDNGRFCKGMRVPNCVRSQISPTYFVYEGRLPRWKGRF